MVGARSSDPSSDVGTLGRGRGRELVANGPASGLHFYALAGFGILQLDDSHVGQLELAGVDDLNGQGLLASRQRTQ